MVTKNDKELAYDVYMHVLALFIACPTARITSTQMDVYLGMCFKNNPEVRPGSETGVTALSIALKGGLITFEPEGHKMYMMAGPNLKQLADCRSDSDMEALLLVMQGLV